MPIYDASDFDEYIKNLDSIGFQSTQIARGASILKDMISDKKARIFFSFTGNLIASGLRGAIAKIVEKGVVHAIITTAGAIDHDVIKSFIGYEIGSFYENDAALHKKGINRIGNILVKNDRYVKLEQICKDVFKNLNNKANPTDIAKAFGQYIDKNGKDKRKSFLYWAYKNNIPVFCPAITDGAIGLQLYFFMQQKRDFDIAMRDDMNKLANIVLNAEKTGALIIGGGVSKHHVIGINIVRGGLDYAIYITTATEFDGSLSGARSNEAISWGKLKDKAKHIDIHAEASLALPLLLKKAGLF
ncbi:MAG: deoxyhypusine synthase [Candidatus Anstonellales archaeon]